MNEKIDKAIALLLLIPTLVVMPLGCTRTVYVPVESKQIDSLAINTVNQAESFQTLIEQLQTTVCRRDSVVIRYSVIVVVNSDGDVVSKERFHDLQHGYSRDETVFQLQARYDSIIDAQRQDIVSILQSIENTPLPVERELSEWEKIKMDLGGITLGVIACVLLYIILWLVKKFRH